jgi:hypothetical protein
MGRPKAEAASRKDKPLNVRLDAKTRDILAWLVADRRRELGASEEEYKEATYIRALILEKGREKGAPGLDSGADEPRKAGKAPRKAK